MKIYGIRKLRGGVYYEDSIVAATYEDAQDLADAQDAELTGEIQEIYSTERDYDVEGYY